MVADTPIRDWTIGLGMIAVGISCLLVASFPSTWNQVSAWNSTYAPIGELTRIDGRVRLRSSGSPIWHDLTGKRSNVTAGDTVFTDEKGFAKVELTSGVTLDVSPNTLIVVTSIREETSAGGSWLSRISKARAGKRKSVASLEVVKGSATVSFSGEAQPILLKSKNRIIELSSRTPNGSVTLTTSDNGTARLKANTPTDLRLDIVPPGKAVDLNREEEVILDSDQGIVRSKASYLALEPAQGRKIMIRGGRGNTSFRWKLVPGSAPASGILEVTGTQKHTITLDSSQTSAALDLQPGTYKWRVRESGTAPVPDWVDFEIAALNSPAPIGPIEGYVVPATSGSAPVPVHVSWTSPPPAYQVELEVMNQENGSVTHRSIVPDWRTGANLKLPPGRYSWRVRARNNDASLVSDWSVERRFRLGADGFPSLETREVRWLIRDNRLIARLQWNRVPGAESYEVKVSRRGTEPLLEASTRQTFHDFAIPSLSEESVQYQIVAKLSGGRMATGALTQALVQVPAPALIEPAGGSRHPAGVNLLLTWQQLPFARNYRIQVADTPDFSRPVVDQQLAQNFYILKAHQAGKYYWRIMSLSGRITSGWSAPGQFSLVSDPPASRAR